MLCHEINTYARSLKCCLYKLGGTNLSTVENHTYLGVKISNNLNQNKHVQETCAEANRSLGFVERNLHSCRQSTTLASYRSLVRPLLEYSSAVWDPYTKKNINHLKFIQKRAARFVLNDYATKQPGCAIQMVNSLGLEHLETRRKTRHLCIFQQARAGHLSLPIGNFLQPVLRQSRHHHLDSYSIISTSKDCYKHSFVQKTIRDWNTLPHSTSSIPDPDSFKLAVSNLLIQ